MALTATTDHSVSTAAGGRRLQRLWQEYQWPIVVVFLLASLALGYAGFVKYAKAMGLALTPPDLLYLTLQLAMFESGAVAGPVSWELEVARWLVPAITAYTAVLAAASLFRKQLQLIRLRFLRGHIVICGLGEKGSRLAEGFCDAGHRVVVIELNENNPHITRCRERGAIVLVGDAADPALLRRAAVQRSERAISVCGADGTNAEVSVSARQLATGRKGALTCTIHLVDPQLCELLRERELGGTQSPAFRLELFNIFDRGARVLLNRYPLPGVDGGAHIVIVGLGPMGESLVVYAGRDWHDRHGESGSILRISVVDKAAGDTLRLLTGRYPQLAVGCELVPCETGPGEPEFEQAGFLSADAQACGVDRVYVCLGDHAKGLQAALAIRQRLGRDEPEIIVQMPERVGLATLLYGSGAAAGPFRNVHPFGLLERTCTPDLVLGGTHELLARGFHEAYLAGRRQVGEPEGDDRALVPWEALPEDLRESNRRQVDRVGAGLRAAGYGIRPLVDWDAGRHRFQLDEVELMARLEHEQWMGELKREGWTHDPEYKDAVRRTHPDLLPWEALSEEARIKNRRAVEALPALLARAGFQVYRPGN